MRTLLERLKVAWIRFKLLFVREPYGISYKGIVYFNKSACKLFEDND